MPVKIKKMISCKQQVESQIRDSLYLHGLEVSKQLEAETRRLLGMTLENRRPESGFKGAVVKKKGDVARKNKSGINLEFIMLMANTNNLLPHKTWHRVSDGVKDFIADKSYNYPITREARTTPRSLKVGTYKGISGFRHQKKGNKKKGYKGRFFYTTALERLEKSLAKINSRNLLTITIESSES